MNYPNGLNSKCAIETFENSRDVPYNRFERARDRRDFGYPYTTYPYNNYYRKRPDYYTARQESHMLKYMFVAFIMFILAIAILK